MILPADEMLTFAEFIGRLKISSATGRRILAAGKIGFYRVEGSVRIPVESVNEYLSHCYVPRREPRRAEPSNSPGEHRRREGLKMITDQQVENHKPLEEQEENELAPAPFAHGSHKKPFTRVYGAYTVHFRRRYSDARTTEGKFLRTVYNGLVQDLGGQEYINSGQKLILGRILETVRILKCIGDHVDERPNVVQKNGELLPCLGKSYVAYSESLRRNIQALYELANKKPSKIPDFESYIAGKKTE